MPIAINPPVRHISQSEFGELAYEVMRHVFAMHNEMGRFFDEKIYKQELAHRMSNVRLEQPIDVSFESFQKTYFLDVLISDGGLFEFKTTESLTARHRSQLMHYLLLSELSHGKLINMRPESVQHEFVNTTLRRADRIGFAEQAVNWNTAIPAAAALRDRLISILRDWGTGLEISLYEEAVTHFFGGDSRVVADIEVRVENHSPGQQRMRLLAPGVALKLTGLHEELNAFEDHARRLLSHTDLQAIVWANIGLKDVTFTTLER